MTRVLSALVTLVLLATPSAAMAQGGQTNAPPGNSAIDEYLETVPGASGNRAPKTPSSGDTALTAAQRAKLEALGPDGKALADAVESTSSSAKATAKQQSGESFDAQGRSPIGEVFDAAIGRDGDGGMGALLPAILLASLLGVVTLVVLRRRSAS